MLAERCRHCGMHVVRRLKGAVQYAPTTRLNEPLERGGIVPGNGMCSEIGPQMKGRHRHRSAQFGDHRISRRWYIASRVKRYWRSRRQVDAPKSNPTTPRIPRPPE